MTTQQNCRVVNIEISLLRRATKDDTTAFPDSEQEKTTLMSVSTYFKKYGLKQRLKKFLQSISHSHQRIDIIVLKTNIASHIKKFKNKQIIEVSNPQTDYRFYKRI